MSLVTRESYDIRRYPSIPLLAHSVDMSGIGTLIVEALLQQINAPKVPLTQHVVSDEHNIYV